MIFNSGKIEIKMLKNFKLCSFKNLRLFFQYSLLLLFLLYFGENIIRIIKDTWLKEIFLKFESNIIGDILSIALSGYIFWQFVPKAKRRYRFSNHYIYFLSFLTVYYVLIRSSETLRPQIEFIEFSFIAIKYYDLIFSSWIIGFLVFCLTFKKKILIEYNSRLKYDNPIEHDSEDTLGYNKIAIKIASEVLGLKPSTSSFNIGINGEWGSGKSSLINLIEKILDEKSCNEESDHLFLKYSPLLIEKSSNLTTDFLLKLKNTLRKYSIESSHNIRQYIYSLTNKINDLWAFFIMIFQKDTNYEVGLEEVKRIIKSIDRKIIVTIDDLDRLSNEEIYEILRLIRNICDFPNLFFIVAYDKSYLCEKLNINGESKGEKYLEKFFTLDISLPIQDKNIQRKEIADKLQKSLPYLSVFINSAFNVDGNSQQKSSDKEENLVPLNFVDLCITTNRDIIRFINSLLIFNSNYFNEVIFSQFIIMELLKMKYFNLYNSIKTQRIFDISENDVILRINEDYLKNELNSYGQKEKSVIQQTLNELFFLSQNVAERRIDKKSIVNKNRFPLYLSFDESNYVEFSKMETFRE